MINTVATIILHVIIYATVLPILIGVFLVVIWSWGLWRPLARWPRRLGRRQRPGVQQLASALA
jgi:hypothetical protein